MRRKKINLSRGVLFTWGMLSALIFLFVVPQGVCSRLQLTYASVFRWPLAMGRSAALATRRPVQPPEVSAKEYDDLRANQQQLQNKIDNLRAQLQDAQVRNEQLAKLREKPGWESTQFRQARIIIEADQAQNRLYINRGTSDDVARGQFVVSLGDQGSGDESVSIIGIVSAVDARTASVSLITDKGSHMRVGVANLSTQGIMDGLGDRTARIATITREDHKIAIGDPVYGLKQPGLDVPAIAGRVVSCQPDRDNPMLWDIRVEPVCEVAKLGDVIVVVSPPRPQ